MIRQNRTPVESILYFTCQGKVRDNALALLAELGIQTSEKLATYSRSDLKRAVKGVGDETCDYLEDCLRRVRLNFATEHPQAKGKWPPSKIYGRQNAENDILIAMRELREPKTIAEILHLAEQRLREQLKPYERFNGSMLVDGSAFARSVFKYTTAKPYFPGLVRQGKIRRIERGRITLYALKN